MGRGPARGVVTDEEDEQDYDGGVPTHCATCKRPVLSGQGIQVQTKDRIKRYCAGCYKKEAEKSS